MSQDSPIARRTVEIRNGLGLHLRAVEKFVRLSQRCVCEILVVHNGRQSDGKATMDLLLLAAEQGATLSLEARGCDAETAVATLAELIDACFFEDDDGDPVEGAAEALARLLKRVSEKVDGNSIEGKGVAP